MSNTLSFKIYDSIITLPAEWDELADANIFLSRNYLKVLEKAPPENMVCHFIGLFEDRALVGIALSQFLDLNALATFGKRDRCLKTMARNFIFRNFASHVLFIGNNMLTGQNAFVLAEKTNIVEAICALKHATAELKTVFKAKGKKIHITAFKDFKENVISYFATPDFRNNYQFSTQPNMVFSVRENWKSEQDYINALSKKYRDQYKRARKKSDGIEKRKMNLAEIIASEDTIYDLYRHVAENAPFNTFFLPKNHFRVFKEELKDTFLFYGYFFEGKLIGFNTLVKNGEALDTYFLGYDDVLQREKMLYLNMLYDMVAYAVNKGYKEIIFARTALEIKSSVGAEPTKMYGFMEHERQFLNPIMDTIFTYLEPESIWQQRHPYKEV